jgi:hypothetical protein
VSRRLIAPLALLAGFALAAGAEAREYRFFHANDKVYYQGSSRRIEPISEPHIHLGRAERAFAKGQRAYAAENLEKAAAGFAYFRERAAGEDRRQLDLAGRALEELAREVRRGDVAEVTTLERAIADARRVLAGEAVMSEPAVAAPQT